MNQTIQGFVKSNQDFSEKPVLYSTGCSRYLYLNSAIFCEFLCYKRIMNDEKINKIEELIAHQEQQIHDLSDMVVKQGDEIHILKRHIGKLEGKIDLLEEDSNSGDDKGLSVTEIAEMNKPPHY